MAMVGVQDEVKETFSSTRVFQWLKVHVCAAGLCTCQPH